RGQLLPQRTVSGRGYGCRASLMEPTAMQLPAAQETAFSVSGTLLGTDRSCQRAPSHLAAIGPLPRTLPTARQPTRPAQETPSRSPPSMRMRLGMGTTRQVPDCHCSAIGVDPRVVLCAVPTARHTVTLVQEIACSALQSRGPTGSGVLRISQRPPFQPSARMRQVQGPECGVYLPTARHIASAHHTASSTAEIPPDGDGTVSTRQRFPLHTSASENTPPDRRAESPTAMQLRAPRPQSPE